MRGVPVTRTRPLEVAVAGAESLHCSRDAGGEVRVILIPRCDNLGVDMVFSTMLAAILPTPH